MSDLERFDNIRVQFGDDSDITLENFCALTDEEANELIALVKRKNDKGTLRNIRKNAQSLGIGYNKIFEW